MAPAEILAPEPGEWVLDLCAAPGGKSTQLAAAMAGQGLLVCNEIHPTRAKILSRNLERLGIANALVLNETPQRLAQRLPGCFHRILVDAPCSGEGMFRKEEAAVTDWSPETVEACARRQLEILTCAGQMLRPGGRLVYSTCTFSPQENEGVISAFLKSHPDFTLLSVPSPWFSPGRPDWVPEPAEGLEKTVRLWPHKLRGEGHFAALLQRGDAPQVSGLPSPLTAAAPAAVLDAFCRETGAVLPAGRFLSFGRSWYLAPEDAFCLDGLKVLRPGLELGQEKPGRWEPAHALALWLKTAGNQLSFPVESPQIAAFLRGEPIPGSLTGWTLIQADGLSLGWAKGSGGILKNHYPKGLRRPLG